MSRKKTPSPAVGELVGKAAPAAPRAELGSSGLQHYGGIITEEWLRQLEGERGRRVFREMADNDPTIGAFLFAVEMVLRNVDWRVEPFSDDPEDKDHAEFVGTLVEDMSSTWEDTVAEILTMLVFGFSSFEIVYKLRGGPDETDPETRSKHDDGKIGWRKLAPRSQDSLDRWEFDPDDGGVLGFWQRQLSGPLVFIPIEKALIFKTTSRKSNPEGRSVLRNAFLPWYRKKRIEEAEAVGIERDLAGLPLMYVGADLWEPENASKLQAYKNIVQKIKSDEQGGLVLPSEFNENGDRIVEFSLVASGSTRLFDTNAISQRYDSQIAGVVLADFLKLGHEKVGSFALSSDKTELFSTALGAWLKEIAAVINRHALPRLFKLNGWDPAKVPTLVPGDVEDAEIVNFASAMAQLTAAGWLTPGSKEDEAVVRDRLNLPEPSDDLFDETTGFRTNPHTGEPALPSRGMGPPAPVPGKPGAPPPNGTAAATTEKPKPEPPVAKYDPSQPRDDHGEWSASGGGGDGGAGSSSGGSHLGPDWKGGAGKDYSAGKVRTKQSKTTTDGWDAYDAHGNHIGEIREGRVAVSESGSRIASGYQRIWYATSGGTPDLPGRSRLGASPNKAAAARRLANDVERRVQEFGGQRVEDARKPK